MSWAAIASKGQQHSTDVGVKLLADDRVTMVLDANALINGLKFSDLSRRYVTTKEVADEVKD